MVVITGAAGFLGSVLCWQLNELGEDRLLLVDELGAGEKWRNLVKRRYLDFLPKDEFLRRVKADALDLPVRAVVHLGARSATTERDAGFLYENNVRYATTLCRWTLARGARFLFASSAATYGNGEHGFDDDSARLPVLRPRNAYAWSKHRVDQWLAMEGLLDRVASLKFFNVFGPNEYHKGPMRSVALQAFEQIRDAGRVKLFASHREDYADGGQLRDFVSVKDCAAVMAWLLEHPEACGIFNVGTGQARSFRDLATAVFQAMGREPAIDYIPMPEPLRAGYQYFTQAGMTRLRNAGYAAPFQTLEAAVTDYVQGHLLTDDWYC
ncbi:ADP-glyceromanno-heptose 6-epimerase [Megalodesulfovibrio gigas]|uniref:ADP-glyceromanno-heptose 6-epimerase n=1 Tax=Megalodesulfovibrio gigas TaxID=879 RepID=UPI0004878DD4|nr:ADP-glyceromanno-heptose 6-epimerase [Megalodesulfovibrio gigas]